MNLFAWFTPKRHDYNLVPGNTSTQTSKAHSFRSSMLKAALVCLLALCSFLAGWLSTSVPRTRRQPVLTLKVSDELFQYNRTFGEAPSIATNTAWESLFPQHGGFFVHPDLAPKRSAFSVFHQMHCLDELRHGFYVLHDQVLEYSDMIGDQAQQAQQRHRAKRALQEHSLGHIRHCIDLLRQSLMCNADLTVELKDEELGGVTGFGTVHRCVDWPGLLDWIKPYEETDAPSG